MLLVSSLIKRSILVYPYFPYAHAEMYHVGDPHAPMRMLKYILGPQETHEELVHNNPSKAIKNTRPEDEKRWWK